MYSNGVKIDVKSAKILDTIPRTPSFDRTFVNTSFSMFFTEKYLNKKIKKCHKNEVDDSKLRVEVLKILRDSERHQTMRGKTVCIL